MKKVFFTLALVAGLLLPATVAQAKYVADRTVNITDAVTENVVAFGGTVNVDAPVSGDLIVFGGTVNVRGNISGDVIAFGGTVVVNATVEGDMRIFGGTVNVNGGSAGKNSTIGGGSVAMEKEFVTKGSALVFGGTVAVRSATDKNLDIAAGDLTFSGLVGGKSEWWIGSDEKQAANINVLPTARIAGNLIYHSTGEYAFPSGVIQGVVSFEKMEMQAKTQEVAASSFAWNFFGAMYGWVAGLVLGGIALTVARRRVVEVVEHMQKEPARAIGWGLVVGLLAPIGLIIALFGFVTIPLVAFVFSIWSAVSLLAQVVAGMAAGKLIYERMKWKGDSVYAHFFVGFTALSILSLIPILGMLVSFVAWVMGVGAFILVRHMWMTGEFQKA